MTTMTLEQVRDAIRKDEVYAGGVTISPWLLKTWADAIDAHLAKGAQDAVPTEMNWEEAYSRGKTIDYMHGWNDFRRVMLHALVPNEVKP